MWKVTQACQRSASLNQCMCLRQAPALNSVLLIAGQCHSMFTHSMVGPPDPVSNIRPLKLREPSNESEKEVQKLRLQMWALKHHFWTQHNTQFKQEKAAFAKGVLQSKRLSGEFEGEDDVSQVTAEELSAFYKQFLDTTYNDQGKFTRDWMRLNVLLTWMQFKYSVKRLFLA